MAQSPEYPDLRWMPPKSWTDANRSSVQLIVIHTTEGSTHGTSAEDGARYNQTRTDGTSAHYFVDNNSVIQGVRTADQAHTAKGQGNRRGIHYELCARAGYSAAWWADDYAEAMLRLAARQAARDARKWDIPVRHLTVSQVAGGAKGFCGHHDISRAFGQSDHTDPGPSFPWSRFLDMVRAELAPPKPQPVEDNMEISDEDANKIARAVLNMRLGRSTETVGMDLQDDDAPAIASLGERLATVEGKLDELLDLLQPEPPVEPPATTG